MSERLRRSSETRASEYDFSDTGRSQPNRRPIAKRREKSARVARPRFPLPARKRRFASATVRSPPPSGRSTADTSWSGTSRSSACASSGSARYSAGETRTRRTSRARRDEPQHSPYPARSMSAEADWQALARHRDQIRATHLRQLFADDPGRADRFSAEAAGLFLDYSKQRITAETLALLLELARASDLRRFIDGMFAGEVLNAT